MIRMLKDPMNKIFLIELMDQSFRSGNNSRIADQVEYLFSKYGHTDIFTAFEQVLIWLFRHLGIYLPDLSVPLFIRYLRDDVSSVVIKGEIPELIEHLKKRQLEHTWVNINIIGEAVLGENEAHERIDKYILALQNPLIDYISVKISTIFSQIVPHAHAWSVEQIASRLQKIYEAAMANPFVDSFGEIRYKFVNLDMEEYRDVRLTVDAFMMALSHDAYRPLYAGIVIQSYLPDALEHLTTLSAWAKERVENGGAPIKVRLVKGANQEMEMTEASLRGWPCVTYLTKAQSDANYKILMNYLLDPEIAGYVHTGIASHNLFDQALGMILARNRGVEASHSAEMLEGMSETAYLLLKKEGLEVILYAPTATQETFTNAIAYLVRRFDENTAEQNFLRHTFGLRVGSAAWEKLLKSYDDSLLALPHMTLRPFRDQNRTSERATPDTDTEAYRFENESDTDFSLPQNQRWADNIRDRWKHIGENGGFHAEPVIAGKAVYPKVRVNVIDKSQYHDRVMVGTYAPATATDLKDAVRIAASDPDGWRSLDSKSRQKILMDAADEFRKHRGDLIGIAAAEVGKVFTETDAEVSEAIDFLNFYPYSVQKFAAISGIRMEGKGVGLIITPWNFPIAIPTGGIAAALASGNTVLFKPASNAVLCGYCLCQCFWDAGVSKNTLQFVPTSGVLAGKHLASDSAVDFVIFTGSESSAYEMITARPDICLCAETGGKDATIVTALADRDQAIKNVVASAFNNSGQKCSATSLLILESEVYDDEHFKQTLIDATASLQTGSVWDFQNRIGPLVTLPSDKLNYALEYLRENESWALAPSYADHANPYMLTPCIRWGTQRGDYCHMNELFGPVLSVMRAKDLAEAIDLVNDTGYGLTSGLESLDEREQNVWKNSILAGNLYINRPTTGAIVLRQPFGGMGKSSIGSGKKAGGYNYVSQFMNFTLSKQDHPISTPSHPFISRLTALSDESGNHQADIVKAVETAHHFSYWIDIEFSREHEYCHLRGESNTVRYLPVQSVLLRLEACDSLHHILSSIAAIKMAGSRLTVSIPSDDYSPSLSWLVAKKSFLLDHEDAFMIESQSKMRRKIDRSERIRFLHPGNVSPTFYKNAADKAIYIAADPFLDHGRIELMHYFVEQTISHSYHRYGNLGRKGGEP